MMKKYIIIVLALAGLVTGCKKKQEAAPCTLSAGSTIASPTEEAMVTAYLSANTITNAIELDNCGMYYVITAPGGSKKPAQCSQITVKYVGSLANGTIFDQTSGTNSATFFLNSSDPSRVFIEGWRRGLPLIGEGGKIRLFIPPALGYGSANFINPSTGTVIIPGNSMLIFDIELISVS
ncbi:MAG: FKBP-type peptidyl-prolyl cis-trans isomerase [Chitinophagaceae bacterium]|nr:FKBP-type peptidyl-prolyl cis-trans isomerase [Chitinophagaceae bacterium]